MKHATFVGDAKKSDVIALQVSSNSGSTYTTVLSLSPTLGTSLQFRTVDILAHVADTMAVRLIATSGWVGRDKNLRLGEVTGEAKGGCNMGKLGECVGEGLGDIQ